MGKSELYGAQLELREQHGKPFFAKQQITNVTYNQLIQPPFFSQKLAEDKTIYRYFTHSNATGHTVSQSMNVLAKKR
jgi:hypothetical protein